MCNREQFITNTKQSEIYCRSKYKYADVSWKGKLVILNYLGYVIRVDYDDSFFLRFMVSILVKMENNDSEDPDLYIKLDTIRYKKFKNEVINLKRGDGVAFNATILSEGSKEGVPILEVFGIRGIEQHYDINPHIHTQGKIF